MSQNKTPSTSWWPKRVFGNWSGSSPSRERLKPSPSKDSLSVKSVQSNCDLSETSNSSDSSVNIIISGVCDQSPEVYSNNKYLNLLMKRVRKRLKMNESDGLERQYWMPDSNAKECYECGEKFTALRRRHHCRICGQIFCTKCCNEEIDGKLIGQSSRGYVRACNYCHKIVMSYINDRNNDSNSAINRDTEFSQFRQILMSKSISSVDQNDCSRSDEQRLGVSQGSSSGLSHSSSFKRKSSVGFREEDYAKPKTRVLEIDNEVDSSHSPIHTLSSFNIYKTPLKTANTSVSDLLPLRTDEVSREPLWVKEINEGDEIQSFEKIEHDSSSDTIEVMNSYGIGDTELRSNSSPNSSARRLALSTSTYDIELDFAKDRVSISKANKNKEDPVTQIQKEFKINLSDERINSSDEGINNEQFVVTTTSNWESLKEGSEERMAYDALNNAYNQLYNKLLTQLLEYEGLSLSWLNVIQKISAKVSAVVRPNSHNDLEEMDIRNYVKIKIIPNGVKNDCHIINGVVFSKNVAHRKMRQTIVHPRILLLSCPIVYQRTEKKLTFLDPVLLQENEYIKNMVAKICSYQPDLILVEKTVARIAQELLLANDITLICNVKPVVLERISRFTGAAIVSSLDAQIGVPQLGICQKFYLQTFNQKTLMYFDGCPQHLGCTILLRGGSLEELRKIKSICSFMVFCDFNWQLERSFLMDEYSFPPEVHENLREESIDSNTLRDSPRKERSIGSIIIDDNSDPLRSMATDTNSREASSPIETYIPQQNDTQEEDFLDLNRKMSHFLSKLQLSCSPFITVPLPYLMTPEGNNCELRKYFNPKLVWSKRFETDSSKSNELFKVENSINLRNREQSSPTEIVSVKKHPFLTRDLKTSANSHEIKSLVADFRARGPLLVQKPKQMKESNVKSDEKSNEKPTPRIDVLDPKYHQHLPVLFSSFSYASTNAPNYCVKPWVVNMDFYGCNDIPLGGFLERYCFRSTYSCPSTSCSTPMIEHVRRFVHSNGCVLIVLRQLQQNVEAAQSSIITWSWCQKCKTGTPYSNLSSDSWSLSFAKYLELKFYASSYRRRGTSSSVSCLEHSLHKDHFQFFAYKQVVASFKYSPIVLHEIALPPTRIIIHCNSFCRQTFIENLKQIAVRGYEIYSLILEKLCLIKDETSGTKYEIIVNEFMAIETRERANFRQKIEEIQLALTSPIESFDARKICKLEDNFIQLKKLIAESVQNWNVKIQDFVNNKKKEEKLSAKSGTQTNNLSVQSKLSSTPNTQSEEQVANSSANDCSSVLEEANINPRTFSMSSAASLVSSTETMKQETDSAEKLKACIQEQEKECQETLEALEHIIIEDSTEENDEDQVDDYVSIRDSSLSVSSYGYDVDIGINTCLGTGIDFEADSDNYAVYNIHNSSDELKKQEDSQSVRSSIASINPILNTSQSVSTRVDLTPFTMRRIIKELLSNASNLIIDNPFSTSEHYLLATNKENIAVVVKDDDPGSIIAYALTSSDYDKQLADISRLSSSPNVKRKLTSSAELENINDSSASKPSSNSMSQHIDLQFSDSTTKFYCCVYYAEQFRKFRANISDSYNGEEMYIRSLTNCVPWKARGGKSGSTFCKTVNDRFILKEMSKLELQSFLSIANYYFDYCTRAINESRPTLLAKIVGVYRTSYKNSTTNSASKLYLLVMENLFYNCNITQKFDLKGSMRNRLVDTNSPNLKADQVVLLDENLLQMTCDCPLYIQSHSKTILRAAIDNDSLFLSSHSVMDYSLLVGIDDERNEFVVGIIDYIRPFTWDKKIESVVKSVGSQGKLPTIVQPDLYRIRFCEAMDQYFLCVPDKWFSIVNFN